jgi:hypothetical protein
VPSLILTMKEERGRQESLRSMSLGFLEQNAGTDDSSRQERESNDGIGETLTGAGGFRSSFGREF